ncbi:MAG: histone deacetylase [Myxococcaceae bacterium]|nr:histone deacetylase [Myxococcaceae bacterium]MCA3014372.1 histone deacetylase [Myxococcaceae bacterium]
MHPESPGRLRAVRAALDATPVPGTRAEAARKATRDELLAVHHQAHVAHVLSLRGRSSQLDPDTAMGPSSADAALLAAGAAVEATVAVMEGRATNAFALVRPPGHHAEADRAMGFCLFNNVAVAAEAAKRAGAERVLVLDWDVHHGNGTQHLFEARRDVLFCSAHQHPYYPGTGAPHETGHGEGAGYTVNVALPGGRRDADYGAVFHDVFLPIARAFRPDVVLVSAGFDPHEADPVGGMDVTERGFAAMACAMKQLADELCRGRLALFLEGGYDLGALGRSVHACVEVLAGHRRDDFPTGVSAQAQASITETRSALRGWWSART